MTKLRLLTGSGAVLAGFLVAASVAGAQISGYTVGELLGPCIVGDNDSREGATSETECEQYIRGFTDAYIMGGGAKSDNVCLPAQNRDDEVRWAFMRWAHQNFDDRGIPAAEGLHATVKASFPCR